MKILRMMTIATALFLTACAGYSGMEDKSDHPMVPNKSPVYQDLKNALEKDGAQIDYDTLLSIYRTMVQSKSPISRIEYLLQELIDQRCDNPRIDQMVLILAAKVIGASKYPIPNAGDLFERILTQEPRRINYWVLNFVAEAIGDYRVDLPEGDRLVDRVEQWLATLASASPPQGEFFGHHFMPPPKSDYIRNYISRIGPQHIRERERAHYYTLIYNKIAEKDIEDALRYLQTQGVPDTGVTPDMPMKYLVRYWERVYAQINETAEEKPKRAQEAIQ